MGFRVQGSGFRVQGSGFRVQGSGFGVWGLGFGVWGLGFGVWGLGFGAFFLASHLEMRTKSVLGGERGSGSGSFGSVTFMEGLGALGFWV